MRGFPSRKSFSYLLIQRLSGGMKARRLCIRRYVEALPGQRILDIGCGPGYVLDYLPEVDYLGFDTDPDHIRYATRRYAGRGQFQCGLFNDKTVIRLGRFDRIFMFGLLHHLDDHQAKDYLTLTRDLLNPHGRLVSLDGVWIDNQSPVARWILSHDEGKFVRREEEYRNLASGIFPHIRSFVHEDLFFIPYSAVILDCRTGERVTG